MNFDIPLAGWLLSVITFGMGTILPFLYSRFFHEGISIQQYDIRATNQDENDKKEKQIIFSTVIKFANAQKESILLEGINTFLVKSEKNNFKPVNFQLSIRDPKEQIYLPPRIEPDVIFDHLPILIKSDEEKIIAIGFKFQYTNLVDDENIVHEFGQYIEKHGLPVAFRINGKYRKYAMKVRRLN